MSESNTSAAIMSVCRFYTFLHPAQHGFNCQKITQQVAQRPSLQLRREVYHEQQQHTSIEGHCNDPQWLCLAASSGSPPGSSGKFWARHSRNRRHQMATAAWEGRVIEVFVEFKGHVLVRELCQSDTGWEVLLKDFESWSTLQELRSPETISMSHLDSFSVTSMNLAAAESDEISPEPCHGGRPMISMPHPPSSTHSPLYWLAHRDARTDMKIEHLAKVQSILQKNMNSSQCCHSPQWDRKLYT